MKKEKSEQQPVCHPERNEVESKDLCLTAVAEDLCLKVVSEDLNNPVQNVHQNSLCFPLECCVLH